MGIEHLSVFPLHFRPLPRRHIRRLRHFARNSQHSRRDNYVSRRFIGSHVHRTGNHSIMLRHAHRSLHWNG